MEPAPMFQSEHWLNVPTGTFENGENQGPKLLILCAGLSQTNGIKRLGCGRNVYFRGRRMTTKVDLTAHSVDFDGFSTLNKRARAL